MENNRGYWVEAREERGEKFEALMGKCEYCNQPMVRSRVLRMSKEDVKRWKWLDDHKTKGIGWIALWCPVVVALSLLCVSIIDSIFLGVLAFTGTLGLLYLLPFFLIYGKRDRVVDAEKKEILRRYGEYKLEDVNFDEWYWKKYRILPQEEV